MTWTYNSSQVGSSGLATVRWYIGDVSSGDQLRSDEEINAVLTNITSNTKLAAIQILDSLAAYYSRQADTHNEGLDVLASQRAKAFRQQAASLRSDAYVGAEVFVGGRSISEKDDRAADTDLVQPSFERDMDDFPGTIASSTE